MTLVAAPGFGTESASTSKNSDARAQALGGEASFDVQRWLKRIRSAERDRDAEMAKVWRFIDRRYTSRNDSAVWFTDAGITLKQPRPPRIYSIVHAIEASLFYQHPKYFCKQKAVKYEKLARLMEPLAQTLWREAVPEDELQWAIRATTKRGRSWMLLGYDSDFEAEARDRRAREEVAEGEQADVFAETLSARDMMSTAATPETEEAGEAENEVEPANYELDARVARRRMCARFVSNWDVVHDPAARCFPEVGWIARRLDLQLEVVKADKSLKNTEGLMPDGVIKRKGVGRSKNSSPAFKVNTPDKGVDMGAQNAENSTVRMWELFYRVVDPKTMEVTWDMVLLSEQGKLHRYEVAPYWFGCPYETLSWNHDGETMFTTSDIEQLLPIIVEEGDLREKMYRFFLRRCKDPVLMTKAILGDAAQIRQMEVGGVGAVVGVNEPPNNQPLQAHIAVIPKSYELGDIMAHIAVLDREIQATTGLGANQQAQAMKSDTSAYEAKNVEMHAEARTIDKQKALESFCSRLMLKLLVLAAQYYDAERVSESASDEVAAQWRMLKFSPGDVQDGLHVFVEKGSMRPQSDEQRAATYGQLLQLKRDPIFGPCLNGEPLLKRFFESNDIPEGSELLNPEAIKQVDAANQMAQAVQMGGMPARGAPGAQNAGGRPPGGGMS